MKKMRRNAWPCVFRGSESTCGLVGWKPAGRWAKEDPFNQMTLSTLAFHTQNDWKGSFHTNGGWAPFRTWISWKPVGSPPPRFISKLLISHLERVPQNPTITYDHHPGVLGWSILQVFGPKSQVKPMGKTFRFTFAPKIGVSFVFSQFNPKKPEKNRVQKDLSFFQGLYFQVPCFFWGEYLIYLGESSMWTHSVSKPLGINKLRKIPQLESCFWNMRLCTEAFVNFFLVACSSFSAWISLGNLWGGIKKKLDQAAKRYFSEHTKAIWPTKCRELAGLFFFQGMSFFRQRKYDMADMKIPDPFPTRMFAVSRKIGIPFPSFNPPRRGKHDLLMEEIPNRFTKNI